MRKNEIPQNFTLSLFFIWIRDWLRFARPSLFGYFFAGNQEPPDGISTDFLFGVGIGFASLAHPCLGFLCKKQERCRVFLVLFSTRLVRFSRNLLW